MIRRVVVAGGGTGGHLFPGMAVVEELRSRIPNLEVTYVGTERGIESRVLPAAGEQLELLSVSPLKGTSSKELLQGLSRLPLAAAASLALLRRLAPDLVIGVGGYASGPVLSAACALSQPTAVLEQNAHVGLTNRLLAPLVGRAYVSFEEAAGVFPKQKVRVTGNPLRSALAMVAKQALIDPDGFDARGDTLLVLGGSQGSARLNEVVPRLLAGLLGRRAREDERAGAAPLRVVHQVGRGSVEEASRVYREAGVEAEVLPFIEDMASAYRRAAVVVARAGASTVSELTAVGRPAVLVPYPHAADDHQRKNAMALASRGAAVCVAEDDLAGGGLREALEGLLAKPAMRREMARAARRLGHADAAATVVDDLQRWLEPREQAHALAVTAGQPRHGLRGERPYIPRTRVRRCVMTPEHRFALSGAVLACAE